jgi:hypothetical protein
MIENPIKSFPLMINNELIIRIQTLTQDYYSSNKKYAILNKNQKLDCSNFIWNNITPSNILIDSTIFIDENKIYVYYPLFKLYANPDIYDLIINYTTECILKIIEEYGIYEFHINIDGFTISAGERYSQLINMIILKLFNINFSNYLDKMYIYNPPSVIEYLRPIFRNVINNKSLMDKVVIMK